MTAWKLLLVILALVLPGGSILLLALATAKALGPGKGRSAAGTAATAVPAVSLAVRGAG